MDKMLRPASLKQAMSLRRSTAALPVMFRSATPAYTEGSLLDLSGCEEFSRMDTDGVLLHIGAGVTAVSSLSYLGLGIAPHIPEWGNILKTGNQYLETNPYIAIFPGIAIVVLVLAFNFLGDGLRDALDPKMK